MSDLPTPLRALAVVLVIALAASCSADGGPAAPVVPSRLDGSPLDPRRLARYRELGQRCLFAVAGAADGEQLVVTVPRHALPFSIPPLASRTPRAPGRVVKFLMPVDGTAALLQVQCIVPADYALADLLRTMDASRASPRWQRIWRHLLASRPVAVGRPPALPPEAREVLWEMLGAAASAEKASPALGLHLSASGGCQPGATCLPTVTITAPAPGATGSTSLGSGASSGNPEIPDGYLLSPDETMLDTGDESLGGNATPPRDSSGAETAPRCDSRVNGCEDTLSARERALLDSILGFARDTSQMSDSLRLACAAMQREFATLLHSGHVFRGNSSVSDSTTGSHGALYYDGNMHVDGRWLDLALKDRTADHIYRKLVASMVLHEAGHALGFGHRSGYRSGDYITEYPFRYTNYYDPSSCVAY